MRIFLDTEFTDFIDCHLMSLGAVTEDGQEFYVEINDYPKEAESRWVKENVVPLMQGGNVSMTRLQAADEFFCWVTKLNQTCSLCIDYMTDWDLTVDMLDELWPLRLMTEPMMLYPELQAQVTMKFMARDLTLVPGAADRDLSLAESIAKTRDIFSDGFMDHFFQRRAVPGYKQHHALYDARANRDGFLEAVKFIKGINDFSIRS